jgi:uncharacterized protein YlxP (DUF503 family)
MVLTCRYDLRLPGVSSLKEKRSRIRPVVDRVRHRHHLSVAEVDHQDDHGRSTIQVAVVASTAGLAETTLDAVDRLVWSADGVEVVEAARTWLEED